MISEMQYLLDGINDKSRFYLYHIDMTVYIFDGYTFSFYECPKSFYINAGKLIYVNKKEKIIDVIFLRDILNKYMVINNKTGCSMVHQNYDINTINSFYNFIFKSLINNIQNTDLINDKYNTILFYIRKLVKKTITHTQKQISCKQCVFRYLCEQSYNSICTGEKLFFSYFVQKIFELFYNFDKERIYNFYENNFQLFSGEEK